MPVLEKKLLRYPVILRRLDIPIRKSWPLLLVLCILYAYLEGSFESPTLGLASHAIHFIVDLRNSRL